MNLNNESRESGCFHMFSSLINVLGVIFSVDAIFTAVSKVHVAVSFSCLEFRGIKAATPSLDQLCS
jgi:hypothetical protein